MLVRLLLLILLAWSAVPATASVSACHDTGMAAGMPGMAMAPHDAPEPAPPHACVGCVPIADWLRAPVVPPLLAQPLPSDLRVVRMDLGRHGPPALPPPRVA